MPEVDGLHVILLMFGLGGVALTWWWTRGRTGRRNRARQRVASKGEARAERLLGRAGFKVVERQATRRWTMWIDGEPVEVSCRADLIVRRRGREYVAEVKTGDRAVKARAPATRRQLMEYRHVFDVDGLILVDMAHGVLHWVAFEAS